MVSRMLLATFHVNETGLWMGGVGGVGIGKHLKVLDGITDMKNA